MRPWPMLQQSFSSIMHNGFRSFLTVLGIVIGIVAVISVMGLGQGLQDSVTGSLGDLGTTKITVSSADPERQTVERNTPMRPGGGGGQPTGGAEPTITEQDYEQILGLERVAAASPSTQRALEVAKKKGADTAESYQAVGVGSQYATIEELTVADGEFLTEGQVDKSRKTVVLGATAAEELFGAKDPIGRDLYLDDVKFEVTGVLAPAANSDPRSDPDGQLYLGYQRWLDLADQDALSSVKLLAVDEEAVEPLVAQVEDLLAENHDVAAGENPDFTVTAATALLQTRSDIVDGFTKTLIGIAAISLLVGGIGIMNIMLVTVTERTREIGLRRAVGARSSHILAQFLTESVVLTTLGGLIGLGLGYLFSSQATKLVSFGPARLSDAAVSIDPTIAAVAVGISVLVGIVFGLFPAMRAARLDPASALRYE